MVTVRIHVEGGGDEPALHTEFRRAFAAFFEKAGLKGQLPKVIPCGPRHQAWNSFRKAVQNAKAGFIEILLVDSEDPVDPHSDVWSHLKRRDNWDRPAGVDDDSAHLLVQCMEAWFLADRPTLAAYFGKGFNESKLPAITDVEAVPKPQLFESLKQATHATKTKGRYGKGEHSFQILGKLDASKVLAASPHATAFIETLKSRAS